MKHDAGLVWFRRDLRLDDNGALAAALAACRRVYCAFVFDRAILDPLLAAGATADRRVEFIHAAIIELDHAPAATRCRTRRPARIGRRGDSAAGERSDVGVVFASEDYEPYARERDATVERALAADGRRFVRCKDHVIFEKSEVVTGAGRPFGVFTPYKNAWLRRLTPAELAPAQLHRRP